MYERYYGLTDRPFDLSPNPRYLFLTPKHQEALSNLQHGIAQRKGVTVVLGPAGTGKTTLIRAALAGFAGATSRCVSLSNPAMTREEFVQTLAHGFGLSDAASRSKATLLVELEQRLRQLNAENAVTALIVDEAQALPNELLEEVRLLVNMETDTQKLLPVVLVGQPELADRLNEPSVYALKQRVALRCELAPLSLTETAQYISTRVMLAGGVPGQLFTREAVDLIYQRSGGIPRVISVICDNALLSGYALERRPVDRKIVVEVCADFDFAAPGTAARQTDAGSTQRALAADAGAGVETVEDGDDAEGDRPVAEPTANTNLLRTFGATRSWFSKRAASR